jgi:hypothetical protein
MSLRFININPLMAPEDAPAGGGSTGGLGKEEMIELLGEESDESLDLGTPPKDAGKKAGEAGETQDETPEDSEEKPEEVDELKELEEELEGPKEEDLELMTPVRRREILKKYPSLFKDFPYLEKAYYREQQFTELLPTIQDAKIAVQKAEVLDNFDRQIMSGDITNVLKAAKEEDNEAFLKIADNYLPTLRKVDQNAYYHVLGNVIKDTIVTMVREARSMGDNGQPLQAAANILNQFVFGTNTFTPPQPLSKGMKPEEEGKENELRQREQQIVMGQFEQTRDDLQVRTDNVLKATIDGHIDPKKSMTDYVRKNASREAFETLENLMTKDTRFRGLLDKLWEKAFEDKFSKESTDRIKSAYLSKAKTLLPSVIKKARNDALRGLGKRVKEDEEQEDTSSSTARRGPITQGRSSTQVPAGKIKKPSDIPRGMRTIDVLMQD